MTFIVSAVFVAMAFVLFAWWLRADRREQQASPYRDLGLVKGHIVARYEPNEDEPC